MEDKYVGIKLSDSVTRRLRCTKELARRVVPSRFALMETDVQTVMLRTWDGEDTGACRSRCVLRFGIGFRGVFADSSDWPDWLLLQLSRAILRRGYVVDEAVVFQESSLE